MDVCGLYITIIKEKKKKERKEMEIKSDHIKI